MDVPSSLWFLYTTVQVGQPPLLSPNNLLCLAPNPRHPRFYPAVLESSVSSLRLPRQGAFNLVVPYSLPYPKVFSRSEPASNWDTYRCFGVACLSVDRILSLAALE